MASGPGPTSAILTQKFGEDWDNPVGQIMKSSGYAPPTEAQEVPKMSRSESASSSSPSASSASTLSSLPSKTEYDFDDNNGTPQVIPTEQVSEAQPTVLDIARLPSGGHENPAFNDYQSEVEEPADEKEPELPPRPDEGRSSEYASALSRPVESSPPDNNATYENVAVEMTPIAEVENLEQKPEDLEEGDNEEPLPGGYKRREGGPKAMKKTKGRRPTQGLVQSGLVVEPDADELGEEPEKGDAVIDVSPETPKAAPEPLAKKPPPKPDTVIKAVSWRSMFRYSSRTDRILMFIGLICAIIHGVAMPCCLLLYREILNILIYTDVQKFEIEWTKKYCDYICNNASDFLRTNCTGPHTLLLPADDGLEWIEKEWMASDWLDAYPVVPAVMKAMSGFSPANYATLSTYGFNLKNLTDKIPEWVTANCSAANYTDSLCHNLPLSDTLQIFQQKYNETCTIRPLTTWENVQPYVFGIIGVGILTVCVAFTHILLWNLSAERQVCRIRSALFESILSKHIGWFDLRDARALNSQLYDETSKLLDGLGDKISVTIQMFMTFITGFVISFAVNPEIAGVVCSLVPVLLLLAFILTRTLRMFSSKQSAAYAKASSLSVQTLGNIRTVTAFGRQNFEVDRYGNNLRDAQMTGIRKSVFTGLGQGAIWFTLTACQVLTLWYGLNQAGDLTQGGDVSLVMLGIMVGAMQFGQAAPNLEIIATARAAAGEIYSIIDEPTQLNHFTKEGKRPQSVQGAIEVENVKFAYPKDPSSLILKGLSFSVKPGQTVALVGASGSGKSTIIQILLRFYDALSGRVTLDGEDITQVNVGWLREQIGFVGQEPVLFSRSIAENIKMGKPDATMDDIIQACKLSNAHSFINLLPDKYDTFVGDRGAQLSGGQKQRIAIARGIIKNPRILLLDEATSALDTHSERTVQEALDRASAGRTTIVIAHRLSTIKNADLILVLDRGEIVEAGTHVDLMEKGEGGAYYALAKTQQLSEAISAHDDPEDVDEDSPEAIYKRLTFSSQRKRTSTITSKKDVKIDMRKSSVASVEDIELGRPDDEEEDEEPTKAPMGVVLRWNAKEWYLIVLGSIAACIAGLVYPMQSVIISNQLGNFAELDDSEKAKSSTYYAIAQLIFGIVLAVSFTTQFTFFGISGEVLTARLRRKSFAAMLRQDISWFDLPTNQPGSLAAALATDTTAVQGMSGSRIGVILNLLANVGTSFIYGCIIKWDVTLIAFAVIPIFIIANMITVRINIGAAKRDSSALKKVAQASTEAICNMRTVVALGQHPYFLEEFKGTFEAIVRKVYKRASIQATALGIAHGMIFFSWALVFGYGSVEIDASRLDFVLLFRIYNMATVGGMAAGRMAAFIPDMGRARVAAGKIYELLNMKPTVDWASSEGIKLVEFFGKVELKNVRFHYPNRPDVKILRGLTFKVETGQTVALVGASGCGKSTCLQLIERFYEPTSGDIFIDDKPITTINVSSLRSKMGLISQEPALFDSTIWENIIYGTIDEEKIAGEVPAGLIRRRTQHSVAFVENLRDGFETTVGDRGGQLSGGQKQRVAIARALARNPRLLLCDEATSALDATNEKLVQADIDSAREGRTCMIVAHRLATIQHADKILVFNKGRIAEEGRHEELIEKRGLYYALHMAQNLGGGRH